MPNAKTSVPPSASTASVTGPSREESFRSRSSEPIPRAPEAFQQSVTADEIETLCRRAFGANMTVLSATELGTGDNTTVRVAIAVADQEGWGLGART
ncbi:hypothetical protein ACIOMQ_29775 [Streptomyces sp. NPDC087845]|uniref:hypothetical protein n=1 Tax=Streptomyces sp. NPDC087845 TaxID=3365806 RepID=UPI003827F6A0